MTEVGQDKKVSQVPQARHVTEVGQDTQAGQVTEVGQDSKVTQVPQARQVTKPRHSSTPSD